MAADTSEVARYEARIEALEDGLAEAQRCERIARYGATFRHMDEVEGYPIKYLDETTRCQDYTQEQFDQHVKDIRQYGEHGRRPVGPAVEVDRDEAPHGRANVNGSGKPKLPELTKAQMESALQYQQENPGKTYREAVRYAMGETPQRG